MLNYLKKKKLLYLWVIYPASRLNCWYNTLNFRTLPDCFVKQLVLESLKTKTIVFYFKFIFSLCTLKMKFKMLKVHWVIKFTTNDDQFRWFLYRYLILTIYENIVNYKQFILLQIVLGNLINEVINDLK